MKTKFKSSGSYKKKDKREYYILAGDIRLKKLLIKKGINVSPIYLLIVKEHSQIGRLIRKKIRKELK
jgi:hypothetical protein